MDTEWALACRSGGNRLGNEDSHDQDKGPKQLFSTATSPHCLQKNAAKCGKMEKHVPAERPSSNHTAAKMST